MPFATCRCNLDWARACTAGCAGGELRPERVGRDDATARIDTPEELVAFKHGGILPYVLRQLVGLKN